MEEQPKYDKNFAPMPIAKLLDGKHKFVIPSFQRGYRWEEKQVVDLLEDIWQFANDDTQSNDKYFLQPIVVKATIHNGEDAWEVLDGQQRLTTMLLILKELLRGCMTPKDTAKYSSLLYDITYANRPQLDFDAPNAADNIDSYYLSAAYDVIKKWCEDHEDFTDITRCLFYQSAKRQVYIIWYAVDEGNGDLQSINIFNRLNKGKISLTSSELIKALFIMDHELGSKDRGLAAERLSMEWNEMERKFQNDNFWYFISDDRASAQTRIDTLFDFVTQRPEASDSDYSYREFQKLYDFCREQERGLDSEKRTGEWASDINNMQDAWKQVRNTYDRLVAWHEDNLFYHYVGYLVALGFTPLQIYNHLEQEKHAVKDHEWTVEDTKQSLRRMMMLRFKDGPRYLSKEDIDNFEYGSDYVSRILLLFNIESCRKGHNTRFAFDNYKKEQWDVEHVDSQNDATLQEYDDRMRWLRQVRFILEMEGTTRSLELAETCGRHISVFERNGKVNVDTYRDFYITINKYYSREGGEREEDVDLKNKRKDYLSNLTLLDSSTNRAYKDAPFAYKRYYLIEKDKEGKCFIPLCTRNLFLKYFSDSNSNASYLDNMRWNSADRADYMKAIHKAVDPIFDSISDEPH